MEREKDSASKTVARAALCALCYAALVSCYSPNQQTLEKEVVTLASPGIAVSTAIDRLSSRGFACGGDHPLTCTRMRHRLLPSSCIERVNLEPADRSSNLKVVDVRPILCAGL
jgi:hypothetical protein